MESDNNKATRKHDQGTKRRSLDGDECSKRQCGNSRTTPTRKEIKVRITNRFATSFEPEEHINKKSADFDRKHLVNVEIHEYESAQIIEENGSDNMESLEMQILEPMGTDKQCSSPKSIQGISDVPSTPEKRDTNEDSTCGDNNANDIETDSNKMESSKRIFKIKRKKILLPTGLVSPRDVFRKKTPRKIVKNRMHLLNIHSLQKLQDEKSLTNKKITSIKNMLMDGRLRTALAHQFDTKTIKARDFRILLAASPHVRYISEWQPLWCSLVKFRCPFGDAEPMGILEFNDHVLKMHGFNVNRFCCFVCGSKTSDEAAFHYHLLSKHGLILDDLVDTSRARARDFYHLRIQFVHHIRKNRSYLCRLCKLECDTGNGALQHFDTCHGNMVVFPRYSNDGALLAGGQSGFFDGHSIVERSIGGNEERTRCADGIEHIVKGTKEIRVTFPGHGEESPVLPLLHNSPAGKSTAGNPICLGKGDFLARLTMNIRVHYDIHKFIWDLVKFRCPFDDVKHEMNIDAFEKHVWVEHCLTTSAYCCFACIYSANNTRDIQRHLATKHGIFLDETVNVKAMRSTNLRRIHDEFVHGFTCTICSLPIADGESNYAHFMQHHTHIVVWPKLADGTDVLEIHAAAKKETQEAKEDEEEEGPEQDNRNAENTSHIQTDSTVVDMTDPCRNEPIEKTENEGKREEKQEREEHESRVRENTSDICTNTNAVDTTDLSRSEPIEETENEGKSFNVTKAIEDMNCDLNNNMENVNDAVAKKEDRTNFEEKEERTNVEEKEERTNFEEKEDWTNVEEKEDRTNFEEKEDRTNVEEKEDRTNVEEKEDRTNVEEKEDRTNFEEKEDRTNVEEKEDRTNVEEKEDRTNFEEKEDRTNVEEKEDRTNFEEKEDRTNFEENGYLIKASIATNSDIVKLPERSKLDIANASNEVQAGVDTCPEKPEAQVPKSPMNPKIYKAKSAEKSQAKVSKSPENSSKFKRIKSPDKFKAKKAKLIDKDDKTDEAKSPEKYVTETVNISDKTTNAMGKILGCPEHDVKSLISKAQKKRLRRKYRLKVKDDTPKQIEDTATKAVNDSASNKPPNQIGFIDIVAEKGNEMVEIVEVIDLRDLRSDVPSKIANTQYQTTNYATKSKEGKTDTATKKSENDKSENTNAEVFFIDLTGDEDILEQKDTRIYPKDLTPEQKATAKENIMGQLRDKESMDTIENPYVLQRIDPASPCYMRRVWMDPLRRSAWTPSDIVFTCPFPDTPRIMALNTWMQHMKLCHKLHVRPFCCFICDDTCTETVGEMHCHLMLVHGKSVEETDKLNAWFVFNSHTIMNTFCRKLVDAKRWHFECLVCGNAFKARWQYVAHFKSAHVCFVPKPVQQASQSGIQTSKGIPKRIDAEKNYGPTNATDVLRNPYKVVRKSMQCPDKKTSEGVKNEAKSIVASTKQRRKIKESTDPEIVKAVVNTDNVVLEIVTLRKSMEPERSIAMVTATEGATYADSGAVVKTVSIIENATDTMEKENEVDSSSKLPEDKAKELRPLKAGKTSGEMPYEIQSGVADIATPTEETQAYSISNKQEAHEANATQKSPSTENVDQDLASNESRPVSLSSNQDDESENNSSTEIIIIADSPNGSLTHAELSSGIYITFKEDEDLFKEDTSDSTCEVENESETNRDDVTTITHSVSSDEKSKEVEMITSKQGVSDKREKFDKIDKAGSLIAEQRKKNEQAAGGKSREKGDNSVAPPKTSVPVKPVSKTTLLKPTNPKATVAKETGSTETVLKGPSPKTSEDKPIQPIKEDWRKRIKKSQDLTRVLPFLRLPLEVLETALDVKRIDSDSLRNRLKKSPHWLKTIPDHYKRTDVFKCPYRDTIAGMDFDEFVSHVKQQHGKDVYQFECFCGFATATVDLMHCHLISIHSLTVSDSKMLKILHVVKPTTIARTFCNIKKSNVYICYVCGHRWSGQKKFGKHFEIHHPVLMDQKPTLSRRQRSAFDSTLKKKAVGKGNQSQIGTSDKSKGGKIDQSQVGETDQSQISMVKDADIAGIGLSKVHISGADTEMEDSENQDTTKVEPANADTTKVEEDGGHDKEKQPDGHDDSKPENRTASSQMDSANGNASCNKSESETRMVVNTDETESFRLKPRNENAAYMDTMDTGRIKIIMDNSGKVTEVFSQHSVNKCRATQNQQREILQNPTLLVTVNNSPTKTSEESPESKPTWREILESENLLVTVANEQRYIKKPNKLNMADKDIENEVESDTMSSPIKDDTRNVVTSEGVVGTNHDFEEDKANGAEIISTGKDQETTIPNKDSTSIEIEEPEKYIAYDEKAEGKSVSDRAAPNLMEVELYTEIDLQHRVVPENDTGVPVYITSITRLEPGDKKGVGLESKDIEGEAHVYPEINTYHPMIDKPGVDVTMESTVPPVQKTEITPGTDPVAPEVIEMEINVVTEPSKEKADISLLKTETTSQINCENKHTSPNIQDRTEVETNTGQETKAHGILNTEMNKGLDPTSREFPETDAVSGPDIQVPDITEVKLDDEKGSTDITDKLNSEAITKTQLKSKEKSATESEDEGNSSISEIGTTNRGSPKVDKVVQTCISIEGTQRRLSVDDLIELSQSELNDNSFTSKEKRKFNDTHTTHELDTARVERDETKIGHTISREAEKSSMTSNRQQDKETQMKRKTSKAPCEVDNTENTKTHSGISDGDVGKRDLVTDDISMSFAYGSLMASTDAIPMPASDETSMTSADETLTTSTDESFITSNNETPLNSSDETSLPSVYNTPMTTTDKIACSEGTDAISARVFGESFEEDAEKETPACKTLTIVIIEKEVEPNVNILTVQEEKEFGADEEKMSAIVGEQETVEKEEVYSETSDTSVRIMAPYVEEDKVQEMTYEQNKNDAKNVEVKLYIEDPQDDSDTETITLEVSENSKVAINDQNIEDVLNETSTYDIATKSTIDENASDAETITLEMPQVEPPRMDMTEVDVPGVCQEELSQAKMSDKREDANIMSIQKAVKVQFVTKPSRDEEDIQYEETTKAFEEDSNATMEDATTMRDGEPPVVHKETSTTICEEASSEVTNDRTESVSSDDIESYVAMTIQKVTAEIYGTDKTNGASRARDSANADSIEGVNSAERTDINTDIDTHNQDMSKVENECKIDVTTIDAVDRQISQSVTDEKSSMIEDNATFEVATEPEITPGFNTEIMDVNVTEMTYAKSDPDHMTDPRADKKTPEKDVKMDEQSNEMTEEMKKDNSSKDVQAVANSEASDINTVSSKKIERGKTIIEASSSNVSECPAVSDKMNADKQNDHTGTKPELFGKREETNGRMIEDKQKYGNNQSDDMIDNTSLKETEVASDSEEAFSLRLEETEENSNQSQISNTAEKLEMNQSVTSLAKVTIQSQGAIQTELSKIGLFMMVGVPLAVQGLSGESTETMKDSSEKTTTSETAFDVPTNTEVQCFPIMDSSKQAEVEIVKKHDVCDETTAPKTFETCATKHDNEETLKPIVQYPGFAETKRPMEEEMNTQEDMFQEDTECITKQDIPVGCEKEPEACNATEEKAKPKENIEMDSKSKEENIETIDTRTQSSMHTEQTSVETKDSITGTVENQRDEFSGNRNTSTQDANRTMSVADVQTKDVPKQQQQNDFNDSEMLTIPMTAESLKAIATRALPTRQRLEYHAASMETLTPPCSNILQDITLSIDVDKEPSEKVVGKEHISRDEANQPTSSVNQHETCDSEIADTVPAKPTQLTDFQHNAANDAVSVSTTSPGSLKRNYTTMCSTDVYSKRYDGETCGAFELTRAVDRTIKRMRSDAFEKRSKMEAELVSISDAVDNNHNATADKSIKKERESTMYVDENQNRFVPKLEKIEEETPKCKTSDNTMTTAIKKIENNNGENDNKNVTLELLKVKIEDDVD